MNWWQRGKIIGVVGGAGPVAGICCLKRIFRCAQTMYGCWNDEDFPRILLDSFPFSPMLSESADADQLRWELRACLDGLKERGAEVLIIACNTLHAFLDWDEPRLIHLPKAGAERVLRECSAPPLILCTSISARSRLHNRFFPSAYPDSNVQVKVDLLIERILKGAEDKKMIEQLNELICAQPADTIVLGCTELSLYLEDLTCPRKKIIDPLNEAAKQALAALVCISREVCTP